MRMLRRPLAIVTLAAAITVTMTAQPPARRATTIAALRQYQGFYHQQTVMIVGEIRGDQQRATIGSDDTALTLIARELPREGKMEARGQFLDVGRMSQDDPRLIPFNLLERIRAAYQDRWPKPGEELLLLLSSSGPPPAATSITEPPLRAVAMEPARFENQQIALIGQFRGRNLFGDLPEAPVQHRFSFVLRSGDAAVWVVGVQPKGRNFNFDPGRRLDTGRWVKVAGTVKTAKGLTWLEGTAMELVPEPAQTAAEVEINVPPPPPVEVLFAAPAEGEADVRLAERIRIQVSRDLDPATLKDRVRLTYSAPESKDRGETPPPAIAFTIHYARENRALEIRPAEPFERFRLVTLEILPGVKGTDGGDMPPFKLTFTTGGS